MINNMLGLPKATVACLFDLDGVLTRTATLHQAAWAEAFDDFLQSWARHNGKPFVRYDSHADYAAYVDGKRRADGVRDFLASRGIVVPEGAHDDPPSAETVHGIGNHKNELLLARIDADGVEIYEDSRRYVEAAREAGLRTAVVSSSANTEQILAVTGLSELFEVRVDGVVARERSLPGKPAPDTFLYAARQLDAAPEHAAVFEDALAGVQAGRAGSFGYVVGVDRLGQAEALREHGADVVVASLAELL
jgi:beta-phosphoglucomutase family hydrolase